MQGLCYYRPLAEETEAEVCLANEQLVSFDSNLSALASPISTGQGPGCQKSPWGARPPAVQSPCIYRPSVHLPPLPHPPPVCPWLPPLVISKHAWCAFSNAQSWVGCKELGSTGVGEAENGAHG